MVDDHHRKMALLDRREIRVIVGRRVHHETVHPAASTAAVPSLTLRLGPIATSSSPCPAASQDSARPATKSSAVGSLNE